MPNMTLENCKRQESKPRESKFKSSERSERKVRPQYIRTDRIQTKDPFLVCGKLVLWNFFFSLSFAILLRAFNVVGFLLYDRTFFLPPPFFFRLIPDRNDWLLSLSVHYSLPVLSFLAVFVERIDFHSFFVVTVAKATVLTLTWFFFLRRVKVWFSVLCATPLCVCRLHNGIFRKLYLLIYSS